MNPYKTRQRRCENAFGVMLNFDSNWRFNSPAPIPNGVILAVRDLISRIAAQGDRKSLLENFKRNFAGVAGVPYYTSSDASWAESDLYHLMDQAGENAPAFIDAFYTTCEALRARSPEIGLPDVQRLKSYTRRV